MKKYDITHDEMYWLSKNSIAFISQYMYKSLGEISFTEWSDYATAKRTASVNTVCIWKVKLKSKYSIGWKPVDASSFNYNLN